MKLIKDSVNKLVRVFKKQANGIVTDTTKSKLVKINYPADLNRSANKPTIKAPSIQAKAPATKSVSASKPLPTIPKFSPPDFTEPTKPQAMTSAQVRAEYDSWKKQEKVTELKAKLQNISNNIKGAEAILTMSYTEADSYRQIQAKHKELKAQKKALDSEISNITGQKSTNNFVNTGELYYAFDGHYYFFWSEDKIWIMLAKAGKWGWLKIKGQDQRLANRNEFKLLIDKKYNENDLIERFNVYFPTDWDFVDPFNSQDENNKIIRAYLNMNVDTSKATILY